MGMGSQRQADLTDPNYPGVGVGFVELGVSKLECRKAELAAATALFIIPIESKGKNA